MRTDIEDAFVTALTPLLKPGLGGAASGYLSTLKPAQVPPTPETEDVARLLDSGGPGVLVMSGDATYDDVLPKRRQAEVTFQVLVFAMSRHQRSYENRARGDVSSLTATKDPGLYQILEDIRSKVFGVDLGIECVQRPYITAEQSLVRTAEWSIWQLTFEVDAFIEADDPLAGLTDATEMAVDVNQGGDDTADPVVEADRTLETP